MEEPDRKRLKKNKKHGERGVNTQHKTGGDPVAYQLRATTSRQTETYCKEEAAGL